jgi:hypothetical protein
MKTYFLRGFATCKSKAAFGFARPAFGLVPVSYSKKDRQSLPFLE